MAMWTRVPTAPIPVLIGFSAATDAPGVETARVPFATSLTRLIEENVLLRRRRTIGNAPRVYPRCPDQRRQASPGHVSASRGGRDYAPEEGRGQGRGLGQRLPLEAAESRLELGRRVVYNNFKSEALRRQGPSRYEEALHTVWSALGRTQPGGPYGSGGGGYPPVPEGEDARPRASGGAETRRSSSG